MIYQNIPPYRCPTYPSLPANCRLVTSQTDACCKEPDCIEPQTTVAPSPLSTAAPNPGIVTTTHNKTPQ